MVTGWLCQSVVKLTDQHNHFFDWERVRKIEYQKFSDIILEKYIQNCW